MAGSPRLVVAEDTGSPAGTSTLRPIGLLGHSCHLVVDERGILVHVDCPDRDLWGTWQPRVGSSLAEYLDAWDSKTAVAVDKARTEHRSLAGDFVARAPWAIRPA